VDTAAGLGLPGRDQSDSFIAHVARSGAIFAHAIGGPGDQGLVAVTAGANGTNGTANALVLNAGVFSQGAEMRIGQRTFDDGQGRQYYLLNISL
jgi:hypothetical protein